MIQVAVVLPALSGDYLPEDTSELLERGKLSKYLIITINFEYNRLLQSLAIKICSPASNLASN